MTGGEFKILLLCVGIFVLLPSSLVAIARIFKTCDPEFPGGWLINSFVIILSELCVLGFFIWKFWDDAQDIGFIFGQAIIYAAGVGIHALAIILGTKFMGSIFRAKEPNICPDILMFIFGGTTILWIDLMKGENSLVFRTLKSL